MVMPGDNMQLEIELHHAGGDGEGPAVRDPRRRHAPSAREPLPKSSSKTVRSNRSRVITVQANLRQLTNFE